MDRSIRDNGVRDDAGNRHQAVELGLPVRMGVLLILELAAEMDGGFALPHESMNRV